MSAKAITTKISCWFNHNVFTTLTYRPFYNALNVPILAYLAMELVFSITPGARILIDNNLNNYVLVIFLNKIDSSIWQIILLYQFSLFVCDDESSCWTLKIDYNRMIYYYYLKVNQYYYLMMKLILYQSLNIPYKGRVSMYMPLLIHCWP